MSNEALKAAGLTAAGYNRTEEPSGRCPPAPFSIRVHRCSSVVPVPLPFVFIRGRIGSKKERAGAERKTYPGCRGNIKSGQVYTSKVEFRFASFDKLEVIGIERSR